MPGRGRKIVEGGDLNLNGPYPRWPKDQLSSMLDSLSSALVGLSPVVIGWSLLCLGVRMSSRLTNTRFCALLESMVRLNEDDANVGDSIQG